MSLDLNTKETIRRYDNLKAMFPVQPGHKQNLNKCPWISLYLSERYSLPPPPPPGSISDSCVQPRPYLGGKRTVFLGGLRDGNRVVRTSHTYPYAMFPLRPLSLFTPSSLCLFYFKVLRNFAIFFIFGLLISLTVRHFRNPAPRSFFPAFGRLVTLFSPSFP